MAWDIRLPMLLIPPALLIGWLFWHLVKNNRPDGYKAGLRFSFGRRRAIEFLFSIVFAVVVVVCIASGQVQFGGLVAVIAVFALIASTYVVFMRIPPNWAQGSEKSNPATGSFQYRYWQLLLVVIVGSLWTWAMIDWCILENQRKLALTKQRDHTMLRIRDEVAVEACRSFLYDQLTEAKLREIKAALLRFYEADPHMYGIAVVGRRPDRDGRTWGRIVSTGEIGDAGPLSEPASKDVMRWGGRFDQDGNHYESRFVSIPIETPELRSSTYLFRLRVLFVDPVPEHRPAPK